MLDDEPDFDLPWSDCQGCDGFEPVNDLGLCQECSGKLERDLIRERSWDYSITAFGLSPKNREKLRAATIAQHGKAFELIAPPSAQQEPRRRRRRRRGQ